MKKQKSKSEKGRRPGVATAKSSHTPGPWTLHYGDLHDYGEDGQENGFHITMGNYNRSGGPVIHALRYAEEVFPESKEYPEAEANARLIAAAPDGYVLAKRVIKYLTPYEPRPFLDADSELWKMSNDLVAKVEGQR